MYTTIDNEEKNILVAKNTMRVEMHHHIGSMVTLK